MEKQKKPKKIKKISSIVFWTIIPVAIASAVGGAIYFELKNTKPKEKDYLSPEKFLEECSAINLTASHNITQNAKTIYENYLKAKNEADEKIKQWEKNNKNSSSDKTSKPEAFDLAKYMAIYFKNNLTFEQQKNLVLKYLDLKLGNNNNQLEITYSVTLNYETTNGKFESKKIKGTEKSKYYFKKTQTIDINTVTEDFDNNINFQNNVNKYLEEIKTLLKTKPFEGWFTSKEFKEKAFAWFKKIVDESNVRPTIYNKEEWDLVPFYGYDHDENYQYVKWNPAKGLNELLFDYHYVNKKNPKLKSNGERKILTILDV
ncbi:hypothetical protein [Metamycoplasma buccale]|uniref:hypothetical protein n=1 Tax=Metamycoplasma buccale TaxID=55602 RepID=UPI00398E452F